LAGAPPSVLETGTIVALPSATFPVSELLKITAIQHYEERMLFTSLLLRHPDVRLVYLTSLPVDEAIVDYYLSFLPDPEDARHRLHMVSLQDPGPEPLTEKLLKRPDVTQRVKELAGDRDQAYVLPFNMTEWEGRLTDALGLPHFGPAPHLVDLGSKSGGRRVARRAGVPVPPGRDSLFSLDDLQVAVAELAARSGGSRSLVIKLNHGFSGQGNAIVELDGVSPKLAAANTRFCGEGETWPTYLDKVSADGAVVEELLHEQVASPSAQVRIAPSGAIELLSTHDQILGGPDGHVYLGCRFPADPSYRLEIQEDALKVTEVLASEGVIGSFGIDFLIVGDGSPRVYLSEINLRMGGTTHPLWMTRLVTGSTYDPAKGELVAEGRAKYYVATDNLKSATLVGLTPGQVIQGIARTGLAYDADARTGVTLHLLGAVPGYGKMGVTCIADSPEEAEQLYRDVVGTVERFRS
jgi:hypothetical protein